jgi:hypothetical protein
MSIQGGTVRAGLRFTLLAAAAIAAFASFASTAEAEDGERWSYFIAPYLLAPNMEGTTGVKGITTEVHADPGDIFDHLQFGAMLYAQARKGLWAVAVDWIYMDLGLDGTTALGTSEVDMEQTAFLLTGYRQVAPRLEAMGGAQLSSLRVGLKTTGPVAIDRSTNETWVDPVIGGRAVLIDSPKWRLSLTGDIGGFGLASDFVWQIYPVLLYRTSEALDLAAAYRALGIDYEKGSGSGKFVYDMTTFGPEIGLGFRF